jgi:hypothetical protein
MPAPPCQLLDRMTLLRLEPPTGSSAPSDPQGQVPNPFSFPLSQVNATSLSGGTVKIVDSTTFKVSTTIAVADVTVEPGALRELHVRVSAVLVSNDKSQQFCVVASNSRRMAIYSVIAHSQAFYAEFFY